MFGIEYETCWIIHIPNVISFLLSEILLAEAKYTIRNSAYNIVKCVCVYVCLDVSLCVSAKNPKILAMQKAKSLATKNNQKYFHS